jgi:hypothetical protein
MGISVDPNQGEEHYLENAAALRALLVSLLPTLVHTACSASMLAEASLKAASQSGQQLSDAPDAQTSHTHDRVAVESTLLLLMGSSTVVKYCAILGTLSSTAYSIISTGVQPTSSQPGSGTQSEAPMDAPAAVPGPHQEVPDDLVTGLTALLSLAHTLISGGPWWQEAKADHPLVVVEMLYRTGTVSGWWVGSYSLYLANWCIL